MLAVNPRDSNAYFLRGIAHARLRQFDEAVDDLTTTVALDRRNAALYITYRGIAYLYAGKQKQAVAEFDNAIATAPQFADAYYFQGVALMKLEMRRDAAAAFRQYVKLGSDESLLLKEKSYFDQLSGNP